MDTERQEQQEGEGSQKELLEKSTGTVKSSSCRQSPDAKKCLSKSEVICGRSLHSARWDWRIDLEGQRNHSHSQMSFKALSCTAFFLKSGKTKS